MSILVLPIVFLPKKRRDSLFKKILSLVVFFSEDFKYVESRKGAQLIIINDYTYGRHRYLKNKNATRYNCSTHHNKNCKAALVINGENNIIFSDYEHNHPPGKYMMVENKYIRL